MFPAVVPECQPYGAKNTMAGRVAAGSYPPAAPSYGRNMDFSVPPAVAVGMRIAAHPPRRSGRGR